MTTRPDPGVAPAGANSPEDADLQALAERVVDLVREADGAHEAAVEANVRVVRTRHGLTRFANSFIHQHVGEDTRSVELTLAVDGRTATASTTALGDADLAALVAMTVASAARQPVDPWWPGATPPVEATGTAQFDADTAAADPQARAELVQAFVAADPQLRAAGYLDTEASWVAFASTAGARAAGASTRATLDGIHQTDRSAGSAHQASVRVGDLDAAAAGALAADRARRSAEFVDLDPGVYQVVLGPEAVATVLTFLGFYGFNAKMHLDGASFAELGEQQFDPALTLIDDPADPRAIGLPFDAEGTPRQPVTLVDAGVTTALAHDRRTAKRAGAASTGGAVPGGADFGAFPMNLRLPGGQRSPTELIAEVERGLLVTQFHYVRVLDPKSQVATGLTRNGTFLIEDGAVIGAVGNLRFTQSFVGAFGPGAVLGVGDDDRYADGEFGPGMVICPSVRLAGWNFTGGARG
jgi:predicted Zn-dependent protease